LLSAFSFQLSATISPSYRSLQACNSGNIRMDKSTSMPLSLNACITFNIDLVKYKYNLIYLMYIFRRFFINVYLSSVYFNSFIFSAMESVFGSSLEISFNYFLISYSVSCLSEFNFRWLKTALMFTFLHPCFTRNRTSVT
jgi:hypothetical protein